MNARDFKAIVVIGAAVGVFAQPIVANFAADIRGVVSLPMPLLRIGVFFIFLVLAPLALWMASFIGKIVPVLYQFAKFSAVGTLNTFVDLGVFNIQTFFLGGELSGLTFAAFKAIAFFAHMTNSFFWNKYWTFEANHTPRLGEVVKFYSIAIAGGLINVSVATYVFVGITRPEFASPALWTNIAAPIAGILSALFWDFFWYKYFVFKKTQDNSLSDSQKAPLLP